MGWASAKPSACFAAKSTGRLGYYDVWEEACELLVEACRVSGPDVSPMIDDWAKEGPFFYEPLHPKIRVLNDIAFALLRLAGLYSGAVPAAPEDPLAKNVSWPVYPEIGEQIGVKGDYIFRRDRRPKVVSELPEEMNLEEFIDLSFAGYRRAPPDLSTFPRLSDPRISIVEFVGDSADDAEAFGSADWLEEADAAAAGIVCHEELLDPGGD